MKFLIAIAIGVAAAWFSYWRLERLGRRAWAAALCRAAAVTILLALAFDAGWSNADGRGVPPIVLLDSSLSMSVAGGRYAAARDSAAAWGEVRPFIELRPALAAAVAQGRRIVVVSDGEVAAEGDPDPALLEGVSVRLFPRESMPGVALLRIDGPAVVSTQDTARYEVETTRFGGMGDSALVELKAGGASVGRRWVRFQGGPVARVSFGVPTRKLRGEVAVEASVSAPGDRELRDNSRWGLLRVTPTPGIVLLASPPDWDSRTLYQTLSEVSDLPVRGFVEIEAGTWRDVGKLLPADPATVRRAAREAELLVLKGSPGEIAAGASARGTWLWPSGAGGEAQLAGDWYAAGRAGSPLSDAFVGLPVDSFPPLGPLTPIEPGDDEWIGLTAQLGRRGAERPVITGRERAGARRVFTAGEGLWRWRFRGGASEASYRALVASAVSWLVQTPGGRTVARPVDAVVAADQQVVFAWIGPGAPRAVPVEFRTADSVASDTLRFDGEGRAEVHLSPGVHRYQVEGGGGTLIVEEWSREFLPAPVALTAREAPTGIGTHPVSGREWLPLFAACILLFGLEWALRRHLGLR